MSDKNRLFSFKEDADGSKDPLRIMIEIVKDKDIEDPYKQALLHFAQRKFMNRRIMAYIALACIVLSLAMLFIASFTDNGTALANIEENSTLIVWLEGFLLTIVAAYYGVSAWRPSS